MKKVLISFLSILLISCSGDVENNLSDGSVKKLKYWCAANPQEIELAKKLVAKWNTLHPEIQVEVQPLPAGQSSEEIILAAISAGTTPDVYSNIWPGAISEYIQAGGLVPLDRFPDFDSVVKVRKIPVNLLETFRSRDGHFYQFPWKTNPIMMIYNVKMFKEAGIRKPPKTYSEFFDCAKKITRDTDGDGQIDVWMGYTDTRSIWWQRLFDFYPFYICATGGKTFFEKGELKIDTSSARKVFEFFMENFSKKFFPMSSFQTDPFLAQKIAVRFTGPWTIAYLEANKPSGFEYDFAPIPVPDDFAGEIFTYGDHKNIAIFSNSKHKKEAWEFVKFLVSEEADLLLLEICNQLPIRGDLLENRKFADYFNRNPKMRPFAIQAPFTRAVDEAPEMKEIFDALSREFEACAVYRSKEPSNAVKNFIRRTKTILEWAE